MLLEQPLTPQQIKNIKTFIKKVSALGSEIITESFRRYTLQYILDNNRELVRYDSYNLHLGLTLQEAQHILNINAQSIEKYGGIVLTHKNYSFILIANNLHELILRKENRILNQQEC